MFSRVIPRIKEFYFLPVVFMVPAKGFIEGYEEYIKNKKDEKLLPGILIPTILNKYN